MKDKDTSAEESRIAVLTVAGSDCGGGAGIQADLKVFALSGLFGCSVVTGVTAQNSIDVQAIHPVPVSVIEAQLRSVFSDFPVVAAKTGMLWSREMVEVVSEHLKAAAIPVVVDPVMVTKTGSRLQQKEAVGLVRSHLLPNAAIVTPNLAEASALLDRQVNSLRAMRDAVRGLVDLGAKAAHIKGGHLGLDTCDVFYDGTEIAEIPNGNVVTKHTHGSGCVLSAGITARLACGESPLNAVRGGVRDVASILENAAQIGAGCGAADPLLAGTGFGRVPGAPS